MSKLPVLSGKQLCKILGKMGYRTDHQTGSHIILRHENPPPSQVNCPASEKDRKKYLEGYFTPGGINSKRIQRTIMKYITGFR